MMGARAAVAAAGAVVVVLGVAALATRAPGPGGHENSPATEGAIGGALGCRRPPSFAAGLGFGASSALSTGDGPLPGLALVDPADPGRGYQHPSWTAHGHLGPFILDGDGTVYVAPSPSMDLTLNPPEDQNRILRVDARSGEMTELVRIEPSGPLSPDNPFGVLGLTFDCATDSLYASTVAGSTRRLEIGRIVRVDPQDGGVTRVVADVDAFGLAVFQGGRDRRLYFGSARRPEVWSVPLDGGGAVAAGSAPRRDLVLPEWSDRARRIVFDDEGGMDVLAVPFAFNLAVGLDTPERAVRYRYDAATDGWLSEAGPVSASTGPPGMSTMP